MGKLTRNPDGTLVGSTEIFSGQVERSDWETMARALWRLLDDISTLGDQHHPESTPYVKAVDRMCEKRSEHMHSPDGHRLVVTRAEQVPK